jgi:hypothetical protein
LIASIGLILVACLAGKKPANEPRIINTIVAIIAVENFI